VQVPHLLRPTDLSLDTQNGVSHTLSQTRADEAPAHHHIADCDRWILMDVSHPSSTMQHVRK